VRTGAAVGAGFRVLGEGDLDTPAPRRIGYPACAGHADLLVRSTGRRALTSHELAPQMFP
jgi:hypothetical protein